MSLRPDLDLLYDAPLSGSGNGQWTDCQPGATCGLANAQANWFQTPIQAFQRVTSPPPAFPDAAYSAKVHLPPGANATDRVPTPCDKEACLTHKPTLSGEGSEEWWSWAWQFPTNWPGSVGWGALWQMTTNAFRFPSYGHYSFDAADPNQLKLIMTAGHIRNDGGNYYRTDGAVNKPSNSATWNASATNSNATFKWDWPIYGATTGDFPSATPRAFRKGIWGCFIWHVIWRSGGVSTSPNGINQLWHRWQDETNWTLIFSNVSGDNAIAQVPPCPTLLRNDDKDLDGKFWPIEGGDPAGTQGLIMQSGFYSASSSWTREYYTSGFRRRGSFATASALFTNTSPPPPPPPPPPQDPDIFTALPALDPQAGGPDTRYGNETVYAGRTTMNSDTKRLTKVIVDAETDISILWMWVTLPTGSQTIQLGLYDDAGGLVASGPQKVLGNASYLAPQSGWLRSLLPTPARVAVGTYWLGALTGTTGAMLSRTNDTSVLGEFKSNADTYSDGFSNPWDPLGTLTSADQRFSAVMDGDTTGIVVDPTPPAPVDHSLVITRSTAVARTLSARAGAGDGSLP